MSALSWLNSGLVWVDVTPRALHVLQGETLRTWPLERNGNGGWAESSLTAIRAELAVFLGRKPWQPRCPARCALPANGVTLRRWKVPRGDEEETQRVLSLQIESEFPLPPDELAWGWTKVGESGAVQDVLVAVAKRSSVAEVSQLLEGCGLAPVFTLSALVRAGFVTPRKLESTDGEAWLDVGPDHSEWLVMDGAGPVRLRVLAWGEQTIVREWVSRLGVTAEVAEGWLTRWVGEAGTPDESARPVWEAAVQSLAGLIPSPIPGGRIRLTGRLAGMPAFVSKVAEIVGNGVRVESGGPAGPRAWSAAIRGLREADKAGLWLATESKDAKAVLTHQAPRRWAIVAGILFLGLLLMPYMEAILFQPGLAARVAAVKAHQGQLQMIDRQADFLRHLKQNQAPYLETLLVLGKTIPQGAKMESLNLNRKGEMSLRISMRQPQQVTDFRSKLTDSGFFSSVVVEDQSPTPNRQMIQVRLSGQVKPANLRQGLKILAAEPATESKPGGVAGGAPPGMPPGARGGPGPIPGVTLVGE